MANSAAKKTDPVWLRSWRTRKGRIHVEVRDPSLSMRVVEVRRGKDHTLHIVLEEGK